MELEKGYKTLSRKYQTECFFGDQAKIVATWSFHSLYSPDIAFFVYHLFWFLTNSLNEKYSKSLENFKYLKVWEENNSLLRRVKYS